MKIFALAVLIFALYRIFRLFCPKKTVNKAKANKISLPPEAMDGYEAVIKKRYVLPDRSKPAQHEDRKEESGKTEEKANIFAGGNQISERSIIQNDELPEVFGKDSNPENLDIEKDESEMDSNDELNAEEEAEELRQIMGGVIEGYSAGITYEEFAAVIQEVDTCPEKMTDIDIEVLRNISETDVFEQIISSKESRAARIAYILEREIENTVQDEVVADDKNMELQKFDISQIYD